ncbi:MAG TPA: YtxH domain-containing protein [Puia sp.]|jgi:gas vesicle protein
MRKVFYLILTGIAMGILLAPGKGSETWQKITDCLDDLKTKAKDSFNDLVNGAKDMAKEGRAGAEDAAKEWSN